MCRPGGGQSCVIVAQMAAELADRAERAAPGCLYHLNCRQFLTAPKKRGKITFLARKNSCCCKKHTYVCVFANSRKKMTREFCVWLNAFFRVVNLNPVWSLYSKLLTLCLFHSFQQLPLYNSNVEWGNKKRREYNKACKRNNKISIEMEVRERPMKGRKNLA